jgi:hypothetical protein
MTLPLPDMPPLFYVWIALAAFAGYFFWNDGRWYHRAFVGLLAGVVMHAAATAFLIYILYS